MINDRLNLLQLNNCHRVINRYLCVLLLLMLWEHNCVYTVTLWGLRFLLETSSKNPYDKLLNFRVKNLYEVSEKVKNKNKKTNKLQNR